MVELLWPPVAISFLIGLAVSWAMEALLQPRPLPPWRRPIATIAMHAGIWTVAFGMELALFRRPYFATANVLILQLIIVLVSQAKYQALREPFIFQDFEYFVDAVRHPRLYLPFFGAWRACVAAAVAAAAFAAGLYMEAPIAFGLVIAPMLVVVGALLVWLAGRRRISVSFAPENDLERLGLLSSLLLYAIYERQPVQDMIKDAPFLSRQPATPKESQRPHVIVIQSESFFDVRREYPEVRASVLHHFDALRAGSVQYGELEVAARGANTIRSEFAFLSGFGPAAMGVHQFNPYRRLARSNEIPTIASFLRTQGYRTICIHPYHAHFYARNKVLPKLGFTEFESLSQFVDAPRFGPYVADAAIADRVVNLLNEDSADPLYVHVITMENHGPLHWEAVEEQDRSELLRTPLSADCDELVAYARHLRNSDAMFGRVAQALQLSKRAGGALCIFGDHVPIMSQAYRRLGEPLGTTDYVVWRPGCSGPAAEVTEKIEDLAGILLRNIGF